MATSTALNSLQSEILLGLGTIDGTFLSGGSCLSHAYLHHRVSLDLDFFTVRAETVDEVAAHLAALCRRRGWAIETVQHYPGFRRYRVQDADRDTLVDIVHDAVPQLVPIELKPVIDGARLDDLRDLVANKLTAVLGRGDVKDLVDLYAIEQSGQDVLASLPDAQRKDAGLDVATLAWVLRSVPTDPGRLMLLHAISKAELTAFRDQLVDRLVARALLEAEPK